MDGAPDRPGLDDLQEAAADCKKRPLIVARCCCAAAFSVVASFFFSFLFGVLAIVLGTLTNSATVSVPAECRILSSGVDLRSSKICELSMSNYKAKHVFYPQERPKIWCRDDYYWASVFKVEYTEYFSGHTLNAIVESPKEALPLDCRPNFNAAWLMKSRFKVNETYRCRYTPGTHKADFYADDMFNCHAKDPSMKEIARRFFILLLRSLNSLSLYKEKHGLVMTGVASGIVTGMLCSLGLTITMKIAGVLRSSLARSLDVRKPLIAVTTRFRRACMFIAYVSAMGWLTLQYSKLVGLKRLFFGSGVS